MAPEIIKDICCRVLFRLLLPAVLLVGAVVRYNAVSFIYAVFLLISPLLPSPTNITIRGSTGIYLRIVFIVGLLAVLAHAVFHITLSAVATSDDPYGSMFSNCSANEQLARQILVERLDGVALVDIFRLVLPDVAVFITGLIIYIVCYKLLPEVKNVSPQLPTSVRIQKNGTASNVVDFFGESFLVLFLAAGGIIVPSALSSVYFLSFVVLATIWSLYGHLGRRFNIFRIILLIYCALHILVLHLYQFQFFQEALKPTDLIARILGLTAVVVTECYSTSQIFFYDTSRWPNFVNPAILIVLYYILAFECRRCCSKKVVILDESDGQKDGRKPSRRRQKESERQHLVDAEVRDYSSIEPVNNDQAGSATMLATSGDGEPVDETDDAQDKKEQKRAAWMTVFMYIMRKSYVLSLIAMMAWSITFHSWLTFALLLAACCIWMCPNSRRICYIVSPIILFYGIGLLTMQFIYGMNLTDTELPLTKNGVNLAEIGLKKFKYPCLQLALQVLYTLMFWLTLRQYIRERRQSMLADYEKYPLEQVSPGTSSPLTPRSITEMIPENIQMKQLNQQNGFMYDLSLGIDTSEGIDSNTMIWLGEYIWCLLCKYWILVCGAMLLGISLQEVVVYRIIYMFLFVAFILTFQYAYRLWRVTMKLFWWVVIIYSMAVLIILYTYQFDMVAERWKNSTKLSEETLADIGLEQFDTAGLFRSLLTPTSFLIIIIIQVHYFHTPFLQMCDLDRYKNGGNEAPTTPELVTSETASSGEECSTEQKTKKKTMGKAFKRKFRKVWLKAGGAWEKLTWFLWRLAEIHVFKLVAFIVIMVTTYEVTAVSAVYVVLLSVLLPLTGCHFLFSHIAQFWTALVLLAKMIYQLGLVDNSSWLTNCTETGNKSLPYPLNMTADNAHWAGMTKSDNLSYYLRNYIGILLILVFERIVVYHQTQYYNNPNISKPKTGIIFSDVKRQQADDGIIACMKYFLNFFFYKFGLEICYIMSAITISVRVDVLSVLYTVLLGILLLLSRRGNARFWPVYTIILVILLPVQFLLALGLPLILCHDYDWKGTFSLLKTNQRFELERWLYLPDYIHPPNSYKLIADFFQLLFVCLQWRVFRQELKSGAEEPDGGSNDDIILEVEARMPIPVADFTTKITSFLDVAKNAIFGYMFWVTLAIIFIAGTFRVNLFSMGYVIAVFCFMWFGQEFLTKPLRKLCRAWNFLIGYCFIVLLLKAVLQLPVCVYIQTMETKACWLLQLLGLTCLRPGYFQKITNDCIVETDDTGMAWDVVCFTFLLLQRRIYMSHYFRYVVLDIEAKNRLASIGCQLINRILMREVAKQKEEEKYVLNQIKKKMESLKRRQLALKKNFVEPEDHFQAIRSGDYYLFEDSDEEEIEEEEEGLTTLTIGQDEPTEETGPSPIALISTAVTSGTDEAVKQAEDADKDKEGHKDAKCDDKDEEEEKGGVFTKIKNFLKFILSLLVSLANWLTDLLNRTSYNYRRVAQKMKKNHILVKQQIQNEQKNVIEEEMTEQKTIGDEADQLVVVTTEPVTPTDDMDASKDDLSLSEVDLEKFDEDEEEFNKNQSCVYKLFIAFLFAIVARSELVCYFLMILNHILAASLLSLPLPFFVFLWGMLSVPRPTKTFWITVITYTEAVVVVKYLFQFGFFPWNGKVPDTDPFWPPKILGIEKKDRFALMDLVLLLALFIHRTLLKSYGLWKDEEETDTKTSSTTSSKSSIEASGDGDVVKKSEITVEPTTSSSLEESGGDDEKKESRSPLKALFLPFTNFYKQLTCPDYSATTDVYAPMFICDFINFLIIVFGYQAFGPSQTAGGGDVTSYISENRVPVLFLIMLLAQFVLIVIDRALYLRKNVLGKFIFQILLVVVLHIWLFFILPYSTQKPFIDNKPVQLWYFIKCVYFALSAYQIRSAYPTKILGNFLTKKYNYVNLFLFKGFLAIPFLLELRTLMDWMWTNTTMAIGSWLQMEDIYANIYILKCFRVIEMKYPTPRAQPKRALIKYGVGGLLLFVVIFIIWFPLVIFSFANTVYVPNPPTECTVTVTLAGYQPLFTISGQQQHISTYTEGQYKTLKSKYDKDPVATGFLSNYEAEDISAIKLDGKSTSIWTISPPSLKQLIHDLNTTSTDVNLEFYVTFSRTPNSQAGETLTQLYRKTLTAAEEKDTLQMLRDSNVTEVLITDVFPSFIRLASQKAMPVTSLLGTSKDKYSDISISLKSANATEEVSWWEIIDREPDSQGYLTFITFNERVAPASISAITGYGIIGLYVTFILLIGRMLRLSTTGMASTISFRELPNVDHIIRLCLDIYLVREMREFRLEEDLYAKLIFVYRSAETRIKWTRLRMKDIEEIKKKLQ
ncbi:hypothetical protein ACF0H5_006459 [Mactra antiquata]